MADKTIKTRIIHKHAIEAHWHLAENFIPKQGELIIYDIEIDSDGNTLPLPNGRTEPYTYQRFKIGDGITNVNDLPFATPTKISDLENDANYITNDVPEGETFDGVHLQKPSISLSNDSGGANMSILNNDTIYLYAGSGITVDTAMSVNNNTITDLADPTIDTDAANKKYVDSTVMNSIPTKISDLENDVGYKNYDSVVNIYKDTDGVTRINNYDIDYDNSYLCIDSAFIDIGYPANADSIAVTARNVITINADNTDGGVYIRNVVDPSSDRDAANKRYVDDSIPTKVSDLEQDVGYLNCDEVLNIYKDEENATHLDTLFFDPEFSKISIDSAFITIGDPGLADSILMRARNSVTIGSDGEDKDGRVYIHDLADPTIDNDAANKKYVDNAIPTKMSQLENDAGVICTDDDGNVQVTSRNFVINTSEYVSLTATNGISLECADDGIVYCNPGLQAPVINVLNDPVNPRNATNKQYVDRAISDIETQIGDIETALNSILALQTSYIGGDTK